MVWLYCSVLFLWAGSREQRSTSAAPKSWHEATVAAVFASFPLVLGALFNSANNSPKGQDTLKNPGQKYSLSHRVYMAPDSRKHQPHNNGDVIFLPSICWNS